MTMELKRSNGEKSKTELKVVCKKEGKFYVKFPSIEILIEMTTQYFHELIASGRYSVRYDLNYAT